MITVRLGSRKGRRALGATIALVALVGFVAAFRLMTASAPVSEEQAIERYRAAQEAVDSPAAPRRASEPAATASTTEATTPAAPGARPAPPHARGPTSSPSGAVAVTPESGAGDVLPLPFRPARGVYTYATEGGESISGVPVRNFPTRTYRTVVHDSADRWTDHHLFLEERQVWMSFARRDDGRVVERTRNYVRFGAAEVDETTAFTPPLRSIVLPWQRGREWEGTFSGETYGSYRGTTVEEAVLQVGERQVRTWRDDLHLDLKGSLEGTVRAKRWISPEHAVTVREEYDAEVRKGPFTYVAKWSVHLVSLEPKV